MTDEEYMQRALELAMRGAGWVNPNPLVGGNRQEPDAPHGVRRKRDASLRQ